ncbi:MAG: class I mannose-6-phosphate isomerase [Kiritimatiellae bacterium]|nr:class I mannose-6-phosphate isomerase [Kiritimatiellia bacterium]
MNEPLTVLPNIHTALWGHEEWLVSAHPAGPSIVANGEFADRPLSDAMPGFPLLVKIIDAKDRLSVQVHPNETTALVTGGEPKTEMWHILSADEGAAIYAGLKPGATADDVARAVRDGSFEDIIVRHEVRAGETYFIPGGLVHAIGGGVRIFEVQQSSNTTYRLFDWNRKDSSGNARELHVEKGVQSIDYSLPPPEPVDAIDCPFFKFRTVGQGTKEPFIAVRPAVIYQNSQAVLVPANCQFSIDAASAPVLVAEAVM